MSGEIDRHGEGHVWRQGLESMSSDPGVEIGLYGELGCPN